ncbi:hypothetical protein RRF57_011280 [Xylaria bambusicola]|uniref:Uncharacterized protein n=1 Tax=Xylaria bambusicola TaxID=326684 RepID=A0AAN7V4E8_9PEZI
MSLVSAQKSDAVIRLPAALASLNCSDSGKQHRRRPALKDKPAPAQKTVFQVLVSPPTARLTMAANT